MSEFLAMGGYAVYVWSAYGITLLVLLLNIWSASRRHRAALEQVRRTAASQQPVRRPTVKQI